ASLVIFARVRVDRSLARTALTVFTPFHTLLSVVDLFLITYVLFLLGIDTWKNAPSTLIVLALTFAFVWIVAAWMLYNEFTKEASEIEPSCFSILISFFIITFASSISKIWDSKFNPPAAVKYGLGLIIMAVGFGFLAYGAHG